MHVTVNERIYYLDAMRSVLMMLGVVIHSTQVFNGARHWLVQSPNLLSWADELIAVLHLFRMPAFFVVSGFFCAMTLMRYGPDKFLRVRLVRIIVPLLVIALTINSLQVYLQVQWVDFAFNWADYLTLGQWVSHLWFLIVLIVYFLAFYVLAKILPAGVKQGLLRFNAWLSRYPFWLVALLFPGWQFAILVAGKLGLPLYGGFFGMTELYTLLHYAQFFILGFWLFYNKVWMAQFVKLPIWFSLAGLIGLWLIQRPLDIQNNLQYLISEYCHLCQVWLAVSLCFHVFQRFANQKSKVFFFLSDASYTVYLLHHVLVFSLGTLFATLAAPALLSWLLIMAMTLSLTLACHYFWVQRMPWLRFLLNGKRKV